jgi:hypothetical protein
MWEKRHALLALSCADPATIKANLGVIKPYLGDDEWWLRAAAFAVMHPLIPDSGSVRAMLPAMLASYDADSNLPSRRWGATNFFKEAIAKNREVKQEIIDGMAQSLNRLKVRDGFEQPIDVNNIYETLRYVDMKKHPENAVPILPSIERVYPHLGALPASWTVEGERWGNIGLAKAAELLGKEGRPFVASMKRIRPDLETRTKSSDKQAKNTQEALGRLDEMVKAWEAKFGGVKTE